MRTATLDVLDNYLSKEHDEFQSGNSDIETISKVLKGNGKSLSVKDIYDQIIDKDYYGFKTQNPYNVVRTEFPGVRGFTARNIWYMKKFAEFYTQYGIGVKTMALNLATTVAKLQYNYNQHIKVIPNSAIAVAELGASVFNGRKSLVFGNLSKYGWLICED